jgi:hypothetical protein
LIAWKTHFGNKLLKDGSFTMNVWICVRLDFSSTVPNNLDLDGEYY